MDELIFKIKRILEEDDPTIRVEELIRADDEEPNQDQKIDPGQDSTP